MQEAGQGLSLIHISQKKLGTCYYRGDGVSKDYEKAVEWYRKSAAQGYSIAQYNLGVCCQYGNGVPKDLEKAAEWYEKAAKQGYSPAQKNLGDCCYYGYGVEQDYEKAAEWYGTVSYTHLDVYKRQVYASQMHVFSGIGCG